MTGIWEREENVENISQLFSNVWSALSQFITWLAPRAGRDEPNHVLWLATRAGKMHGAILPARDYPLYPASKISPKAI